ncbi:hypothetical protein Q1695_007362 [Nippostrongylus brasiliensis]|nr:hypothetical protein Q1695_007362 [Nippostrongylus brasiliensis]
MIVCLTCSKYILLKKPFYMSVLFYAVMQTITNIVILVSEIWRDAEFRNACPIYWVAVVVSAANYYFSAFTIFLTSVSRLAATTSGRLRTILLKKNIAFWISMLLFSFSVVAAVINNNFLNDSEICIMTILYSPNFLFCFSGVTVDGTPANEICGFITCQVFRILFAALFIVSWCIYVVAASRICRKRNFSLYVNMKAMMNRSDTSPTVQGCAVASYYLLKPPSKRCLLHQRLSLLVYMVMEFVARGDIMHGELYGYSAEIVHQIGGILTPVVIIVCTIELRDSISVALLC